MANGIIPTVNRVNSIYEREVAVHMNLVANNDLILFNTPADPYVDNNGTQMLAANQATCDAIIGPLNYDIGHVVSTGGGGVAFLGVICSVQRRRRDWIAATDRRSFSCDYVAHEMGHQYGETTRSTHQWFMFGQRGRQHRLRSRKRIDDSSLRRDLHRAELAVE